MAGYIDELQKALKENSIRGVWHGVGEGTPERGNFRRVNGKLEAFDPEKEKPVVDAPTIITDDIPGGVESMLDGSIYHSMSRYKRHLNDNGYEITGGDHLTGKVPERPKVNVEELRDEVERSLMDIKYGRIEFSEKEKQLHLEENRNFKAYKERNK